MAEYCSEIIGKTVKSTKIYSNHIVIFFTDDTFVVIESSGWEIKYASIRTDNYNINPNDYNISELHEIGIITTEERDLLKESLKRKEIENKEAQEKEMFLKLKEKYS